MQHEGEALRLLDRLTEKRTLTLNEWRTLLEQRNGPVASEAQKRAQQLAQSSFGQGIYFRGIVEISNHCQCDCNYCGLRASHAKLSRYRLCDEEILAACQEGYTHGIRTFVLQSGEDPALTDERLCTTLSLIKSRFPDCALTLSLGERSSDSYHSLRQYGCDRYLLRHETASPFLYERLHSARQSFWHRISCLFSLKAEGFQTGCGMMIGPPGQTLSDLALDFVFLQDFAPEMVGIGPFLPHHATPYAKDPPGDISLTLYVVSLCRLLLPGVLMPATTALAAHSKNGFTQGILHGANVVMPQLTPLVHKKDYLLYDKMPVTEPLTQTLEKIENQLQAVGYHLQSGRGDYNDALRTGTKKEQA